MILQRLANGIRNQDWFVIVIEVLVVVVGIFLGLQVDGWNEARKDKKDEQLFLVQLHQDILLAEELSVRVRARRLNRLPEIFDAAEVLFEHVDRNELSEAECTSINAASYFTINVSNLPAYTELAGTGRLGIIENKTLRTALVELQQTQEALSTLILVLTSAPTSVILSSRYPDLIKLKGYFDPDDQEYRAKHSCDLVKMRENQAFLNEFSVAADGYDAYVNDGLAPWSAQFEKTHKLVDGELGIDHGL